MLPPDFPFDSTELNRDPVVMNGSLGPIEPGDAHLLWPLAHQFALASTRQLSEFLPDAPPMTMPGRYEWKRSAQRRVVLRLKSLSAVGLVSRSAVEIPPHRKIPGPLCTWLPGRPPPSPSELVGLIDQAWSAPPSGAKFQPPSVAYRITDRGTGVMKSYSGDIDAATIDGFGLPLKQAACGLHGVAPGGTATARAEYSLSELYFDVHMKSPEFVKGWRMLHRRPLSWILPDVLVYDDHGKLTRALVFAGRWCECIVDRFHRLCSERKMPYEIYGP
ncbi:MAG: hypothetical protein C0501_31775 [Isosphaera sp.]|nr:hypothetical protein [Isosphaera sp.]